MKTIKLVVSALILTLFVSCTTDHIDDRVEQISLNTLLNEYDLWYVDYNSTTGSGDVPFVANAFTLSFRNGIMYANNNIVGIGATGNGLGIQVGYYDTYDMILEADHDLDGLNDFVVTQLNDNTIQLYNAPQNVTYYLEGYQIDTFDYDQLFYDNIEYFLQEYVGWEKTYRSIDGVANVFDYENFLAFTPENLTTFYSSEDQLGTNIDFVNWDYVGAYEVFDVRGYDNLKILTLDYDSGGNEEFELVVINDEVIELYHVDSASAYEFTGREFLQFLKNDSTKKSDKGVSIDGRKRTKVERRTKDRKKH